MHWYQIFTTDADTDTILVKNADTESDTDTTINLRNFFLTRKPYRLFIFTAVHFKYMSIYHWFSSPLLTLHSSSSVFTVASWLLSVASWISISSRILSYITSSIITAILLSPCVTNVFISASAILKSNYTRWGHRSIGSIGRLVLKLNSMKIGLIPMLVSVSVHHSCTYIR